MTARDESGLCGFRSFPERTGRCLVRRRSVPRQALWWAGCGGKTWCLGAGPGVEAADFWPVGRGKAAGHGFTRVLTRIAPVRQHASGSGVPSILWAATRDELIELAKHNSVSRRRWSAAGSARSRLWRGAFGWFPRRFVSLNPSLSSRPRRSTGITSCVRLFRVFVVSVRCVGVWASRRGRLLCEQVERGHSDPLGVAFHSGQGEVAFPAFHRADVGAVYPDELGEGLL